jgi:hypothetical protein
VGQLEYRSKVGEAAAFQDFWLAGPSTLPADLSSATFISPTLQFSCAQFGGHFVEP